MQEYIWNEHIRTRPSMYVGMINGSGFIEMLQFLFGDILKENNSNPIFKIYYYNDYTYKIHFESINNSKILSDLNELSLYKDKISSIGLAILIALSEQISIGYEDSNEEMILIAQQGKIITTNLEIQETQKSMQIDFTLDNTIFKEFQFSYFSLCNYLKQFAYLNPTLKIIAEDHSTTDFQRNVYHFPKGIFQELNDFILQQPYGEPFLKLEIEGQNEDYEYKIGIAYSTLWCDKTLVKTYANNKETYFGGSLLDGILEGLIVSIKDIALKENISISVNKKNVKQQLMAVGAVRGENIVFYGSIQRTLGMPKLKKHIKQVVANKLTSYLESNSDAKDEILNLFRKWEE